MPVVVWQVEVLLEQLFQQLCGFPVIFGPLQDFHGFGEDVGQDGAAGETPQEHGEVVPGMVGLVGVKECRVEETLGLRVNL